MSLLERNKIVPQMDDYDRIDHQWIPYLMRFQKTDQSLSSVSTDQHGFRTTIKNDGRTALTYEGFVEQRDGLPKGVVLGSSVVFGVGASHDKYTIPSILNRTTPYQWFNYGGRAFNSTQEIMLFLLYPQRDIKKLLIVSGINNLILSFLAPKTSDVYNSLFYQSVFEQAMESPLAERTGTRHFLGKLLQRIHHKYFSNGQGESDTPNITAKYANIMRCFERDLELLRALSEAYGFEMYFAFQPIATWIDKELTEEEQRIFSILDQSSLEWKILAHYIRSQKDRYIMDVKKVCDNSNIQFYDMNSSEAFSKKDWLFVDRVHLTDKGYGLAGDIIRQRFHL